MAITKIGTPELFDFSATNTALQLPTGDTASRPTSPSTGEWRFNSELKYVEYYDGADWFQIDTEANIPVASENFNVNTYFGNGATQAIDAKFNEAANFNGSSSIIETPVIPITNTSSFSISSWVYISSLSIGNIVPFAQTRLTTSDGFISLSIRPSTNSIEAVRQASSVGLYQYVSYTWSVGWHNVVWVCTNTNSKLYVNGSSFTGSDEPYTQTGALNYNLQTIGARLRSVQMFYAEGRIDQVRIYDSALSQAAVTALQLETTTTASSLSFPSGETAIATYQLDGNGDDISGNYSATSTTDIGYTGLKFTPDLVWTKNRSSTQNHYLFDSVRGDFKAIYPDLPDAEFSSTNYISFDSDGFTTGSTQNQTNNSYVAWNWKAGGPEVTIAANTVGNTIASDVSANVDAGFSIVKYTGNSTIPSTVAHGLGSAPELIMVKVLNQSYPWNVFSASIGNTKYLKLNESDFEASNISRWNNTSPTSAVFTIGNDGDVNGSGLNYIAYAFHSVAGYSKIGSYTGDGNATGPIETTGFEPSWVMIKSSSSAEPWVIFDSVRNTSNPRTCHLRANSNIAESCLASESVDFNATNFQIKSSWAALNTIGGTYIYMAFAADPT